MKATEGWWTEAVFYEIYIRSFNDSNGDGIGDLNGIAARLDYLADLGVTALWITPFYPSPQVDFGYDVSDHEAIDSQFGTMADFDGLVRAAHRRGLRIVVDVVLNHTSDRHAWFEDSRRSRSSPRRDWYIWRDGAPGGGPPNNWESVFGGPAWTVDERTGQWYYHCFYREQPDLNWRNPEVEARMLGVLKFWLDRGVDGFRLDAVNALYEDPELRDNPVLPAPRVKLTGVVTQVWENNRRPAEVHQALMRVREFVDAQRRDAVLISEAYLEAPDDLARYYGTRRGESMHLPFNFFLAQVPSLDAAQFRHAVESVEHAIANRWPSLVLNNHDIARACDRIGGPAHAEPVGRLLAVMLLTLRGTPFLYYGEEIGMRTDPPRTLDEVRDPVGRTFWPRYKGRDGVRRPMSWNADAGRGFTSGTPWLPFAADARARNVALQAGDSGSILELYRALLRVRARSAALRTGRYESVDAAPGVFAYTRHAGEERVVVALNMSDRDVDACLSERGANASAGRPARIVAGTHRTDGLVDPRLLRLRTFEGVVIM